MVDTGFGHDRLLPGVALADEGVHPSMFGVQDPVFAHAHPQILLVLITPARKFRMLLHTNPTRERGECLETRAGALEDM